MNKPLKTAYGVSLVAVAMLMMLFVSLRAQQPPATPAPQPPGSRRSSRRARRRTRGTRAQTARAGRHQHDRRQPRCVSTARRSRSRRRSIRFSRSRRSPSISAASATAPAPPRPTDVLVLVPNIQRPVDLKSYVTVMGELIKFDPAEVAKKAKDYKIDLPPETVAKYAGRPVLIATSVINDKFDDVAKRLPPPLNAEEAEFQKVMRAVGPAAAALRPAVDSSNAEVAAKNAAILQKGFADTEAFWKPKKAEPTLWAQNARKEVEAVQAAIAAGKWDDAKAHAATVAQACGQCHGVYRERFDDGSFRIKK